MTGPNAKPLAYSEIVRVLMLLPVLIEEKRRRDGLSLREAARQMGDVVLDGRTHGAWRGPRPVQRGQGAALDRRFVMTPAELAALNTRAVESQPPIPEQDFFDRAELFLTQLHRKPRRKRA